MTYIDFGLATDVIDEDGRRGNLVFLRDATHVRSGAAALREQFGYIAFERYDRELGERLFERLGPDMSFGTAETVVGPFPAGLSRLARDQVALSEIRQKVQEALARLGLVR